MCNNYKGLSFYGLSSADCNLLGPNQNNNLNHPGLYFLHAELESGTLVAIYCGQSCSSVKRRLDDHYKKLYNENGIWRTWYIDNKRFIKNIYYTTFETIYAGAIENFIIYYKIFGLTFNLNTVINGHGK